MCVKAYFLIPLLIGTDMWSKQAVVAYFKTHPFFDVTPFLTMTLTWNKGMSFGLFNNTSTWFPTLMLYVVPMIVGGLFIWMVRTSETAIKYALALIISGAIGNFIDRWLYGAVVDFIDVHWYDYHWYTFNLADSYITIGATIVIINDFVLQRKVGCK